MISLRDIVLCTAAVVALGIGGFASGLWVGQGKAAFESQNVRLAALEERIGILYARQQANRAARPPAAAPAVVAPARPAPSAPVQLALEGAPALGPEEAPVTVVAFSDFQCPFCARVVSTLEEVRKVYGDQVRVVFKHFPLPIHPEAQLAHRAAEAAGQQGKFWPMHDRIFSDPKSLGPATLRAYASEIGLELAVFDAALASEAVAKRIQADLDEGGRVGVRGTPTFFVNGRSFSGAQPLEAFERQIDEALASAVARR